MSIERVFVAGAGLMGRLTRAAEAAGVTLWVNDHWETALAAGARALHLGQEDWAGLSPAQRSRLHRSCDDRLAHRRVAGPRERGAAIGRHVDECAHRYFPHSLVLFADFGWYHVQLLHTPMIGDNIVLDFFIP